MGLLCLGCKWRIKVKSGFEKIPPPYKKVFDNLQAFIFFDLSLTTSRIYEASGIVSYYCLLSSPYILYSCIYPYIQGHIITT